MGSVLHVVLRILGIGALVAGGLAIALVALLAVILIGPLIFWLAWSVLNFASAMGLPELGFWGILLATLFLVLSWAGKGHHGDRLPGRPLLVPRHCSGSLAGADVPRLRRRRPRLRRP